MKKIENTLMVQSNSMVDNRGNWGLMENRVYYSILKRINPKSENMLTLRIPLSEIIEEWGLKPNSSYERIASTVNGLLGQRYIEKKFDEKGRSIEVCGKTFFSLIKVNRDTNELLVKINSELEKNFIQLTSNFTKTEFDMLVLLTKGTSQRLYDLLMEYKGLGKRVFHARELECKLKPNADDVKPYDRPNKVEEKLVIPAVDEINEKTNLYVTYLKFGRGEDTHYEFTIQEKDKIGKDAKKKAEKKSSKAEDVIRHLNEVTGHRYNPSGTHSELNARLKEYGVEDCKKVIDYKYRDWEDWDGRNKNMNPTTLFRKSNFAKYLEEMEARVETEEHKPTGLPTEIPDVYDDGYLNLELVREAYAEGRRWYKDPSGVIVNF